MRWEFHPEALEEYRETTLYYAERDPVLALRFVEALRTQSVEFSNPQNVGESSMRMFVATSRAFSLMEFFTPSNRISSSLWL